MHIINIITKNKNIILPQVIDFFFNRGDGINDRQNEINDENKHVSIENLLLPNWGPTEKPGPEYA